MASRLTPFVSGIIFQVKTAQDTQIDAKKTYMAAGVPVVRRSHSIAMGNSCTVMDDEPNRNTHTTASAGLLTRFGKISETMIQLRGARYPF